jgi:hypothetical protein
MATQDETDLLTVFNNIVAVGYSNPQPLKQYLDDNVVLFKLDERGSVSRHEHLLIGKDVVFDYIAQVLFQRDHATFQPTTQTPGVNGNFGEVAGMAQWGDNDHDHDGIISYVFGFRKNTSNVQSDPKWLLLALWGSPD